MNTILPCRLARTKTAGTDFQQNRLIFDANHRAYFNGRCQCDSGDVFDLFSSQGKVSLEKI